MHQSRRPMCAPHPVPIRAFLRVLLLIVPEQIRQVRVITYNSLALLTCTNSTLAPSGNIGCRQIRGAMLEKASFSNFDRSSTKITWLGWKMSAANFHWQVSSLNTTACGFPIETADIKYSTPFTTKETSRHRPLLLADKKVGTSNAFSKGIPISVVTVPSEFI